MNGIVNVLDVRTTHAKNVAHIQCEKTFDKRIR